MLFKFKLAPGLYNTTTCVHNCLPLASIPKPNETPRDCVPFETTCINCDAFCARTAGLPKAVRHISSYLAVKKEKRYKGLVHEGLISRVDRCIFFLHF